MNAILLAFRLRPVAHSFAELEGLTMKIAADQNTAQNAAAAGRYEMAGWGPDPASNKVVIKLDSGYSPQALSDLQAKYGGPRWSQSSPYVGPLPSPSKGRFYDSPPFGDGDQIWFGNNFKAGSEHCTSPFAYIGKNSGTVFNATAGHCGGSSWGTSKRRQRQRPERVGACAQPRERPHPESETIEPMPAASSPGSSTSASRRPPIPAASIRITAAISGEPKINDSAAELPAAATIASTRGSVSCVRARSR
jgi:Alpha-lytic protease prodomain